MSREILRFLTCGSVDDGKSTLIGRMLYDSKMILDDQLRAIESESKKYGTTGQNLDLALLVDGLQSEREQGITIDVAYRFFTTKYKKFIVADTPGHEQYTRNMVTGASTADVAVILIDARKGVLTQTRRHSFIVNLLGIEHVVVAINKMDMVDYSEDVYQEIYNAYQEIADELGIKNILYIPISALNGDNVVNKSSNMSWYRGEALLKSLENIEINIYKSEEFRFAVQYVNRPNLDFRGFCGTISSGELRVGDEITVLPSGKSTKVKAIIDAQSVTEQNREPKISKANASDAITIITQDEIDISRGDMVVHTKQLPVVSNNLKVMLVWLDNRPMSIDENYYIKKGTSIMNGSFEKINYKIDINSYKREVVDRLELNDIASCRLVLSHPVIADKYRKNRANGSFIVIDRISNNTVGAGMIVGLSRRKIEPLSKTYTQAEKELNAYIRKHFPEWDCKRI